MEETQPQPEGPASGYLARALRSNRGANGGTSHLPPGKQFLHHEGYRARFRRHRQVWAQYEKLCKTDGYAAATRERLLDYATELNQRPEVSEVAVMSLAMKAKVHADEAKMTWTAALNQVLNELEAKRVDPARGLEVKVNG
jgi:hypothetical protein